MKKYADLEIALHRRDAERYQVELRFSRPDSETDDRLTQREASWVRLRSLTSDDEAYGKYLGECVFEAQDVQSALEGISVTILASEGNTTLKNMISHLWDGYDILYLVAHGKLVEHAPWV